VSYYKKLLKLGLNIVYYRKYKFLTQEQLAEKADISTSFVAKIENPNIFVGITFEKLCKIAGALDINEMDLLDFRTEQN
jgi:transcriptional regulator with XRE-family HTH domain